MDKKNDLRIWAKNTRKTLDMPLLSKLLVAKIRQMPEYICAKNVMIFYPLKFEVNLLELLEDDKNFFLPKVDGDDLLICPFLKDSILEISKLKIHEPCTNPINPEILDLVIVPALSVDENNYRLGYGGGFYDRFLAKYKITSILPIPKQLAVKELPIDDFDIKVDFAIFA